MKEMVVASLGSIVMYILSITIITLVIPDLYASLIVSLMFTVILCTLIGSQYVVQEVKKLIKENKNSAL